MLPGLQAIGAKCQERRKANRWTQADAATRAGIHRTVISQIENGHYAGSLKAFTLYLTSLGLKLSAIDFSFPQLEDLNTLFDED
ncbi:MULTISPECIES: helix-turn-helix domain-containing protein [Pantoea]|jgi:transcriptional regulator with XRE-family HTH domain|uniref:helix-turn-helix domain-containing protein n=1 Tax=Pantoea TaxID=53335 RepID=UPI0017839200|nr:MULTISPECIES: helix-turn-helix transcriptional regulator [Pantoea]MBD9643070.1 helix-turn-helix transcriptional regulator [Pantoea sp. PNT02]WFL69261.1 helix-turn-helix transcriptional regulator [Pantoea sp. X85]